MTSARNLETDLRNAAASRGATVTLRGSGHFQIQGALLVNYYPFSKKRTAYIAGTTRGLNHATPAQAVAMAFEAPPIADRTRKAERGNSGRYQRWKRKMWKAGFRHCFWCGGLLTHNLGSPDYLTLDHKIPLNRGGLDNPNNWVLTHDKCNQARGHDMPELKASAT